ncbi:MAG: 50S ribosomal protein L35 [Candidatus Andersenbacteria bacterium]|nr:50S ribosomal protein L35 [Candidatus Andersenbacteria bacterium]
MKQKTKQAAKKRFNFSSTGKVKHRTIGQAHFNSRAKGSETRRKHHDGLVAPADMGRIEQLLPYN